jgi:hypothetical protein
LICKPAALGILKSLCTQQLTQTDALQFQLDFLFQLSPNTITHERIWQLVRMDVRGLYGENNVRHADLLCRHGQDVPTTWTTRAFYQLGAAQFAEGLLKTGGGDGATRLYDGQRNGACMFMQSDLHQDGHGQLAVFAQPHHQSLRLAGRHRTLTQRPTAL